MLLPAIVAVLAAAVYAATVGVRVSGRAAPEKLGWMSEQWLAEYRASHGA